MGETVAVLDIRNVLCSRVLICSRNRRFEIYFTVFERSRPRGGTLRTILLLRENARSMKR